MAYGSCYMGGRSDFAGIDELVRHDFAVEQRLATVETASALEVVERDEAQPGDYGACVGLDVHKDRIAVAVRQPGAVKRRAGARAPLSPRRLTVQPNNCA